MNPTEITAVCVGAVTLSAAAWRVLRGVHRLVSIGEHLIERVGALEKTLNNGIRADVKEAAAQAKEARSLAADAARRTSIAEQRAAEDRSHIGRAVNALRAELDVYTNVVITDRARIRQALRDLGADIPDDE